MTVLCGTRYVVVYGIPVFVALPLWHHRFGIAVHSIDLAVLLVYLIAAVVIGIRLGMHSEGLDGYLLGGRSLPWWAILGSIVATETSTATVLSVPGLAFKEQGDFAFLQLAIGYFVGRLLIIFILLPRFFEGRLFTAYELLRQRFGPLTQRVTSMLFLVARNASDGLRLFLSAIALQHFTGQSFVACVVVIGAVTIIYTFVGGMKSVVWNDCIQLVIYVVGALFALGWLINRLPSGIDSIWTFAEAHDKFRMFHWEFSWTEKYTFWSGLIGGAFLTLGTHGTDQLMVQRLLGSRNRRDAGLALGVSGLLVFFQFGLFLFVGVALGAFYDAYPADKVFGTPDEVFSWFIVSELPRGVGLIGLILAAIFAATMSTLSSSLNASATAAVNDFARPMLGNRLNDADYVRLSRVATVAFGVIQMVVAYLGTQLSDTVVNNVLAVAGFTAGPMLGIFLLGTLTPRVSQVGGLCGMLAGIGVLWYVFVRTAIAWPWYAMIGSVTTFLVGCVVTEIVFRISRPDASDVDLTPGSSTS